MKVERAVAKLQEVGPLVAERTTVWRRVRAQWQRFRADAAEELRLALKDAVGFTADENAVHEQRVAAALDAVARDADAVLQAAAPPAPGEQALVDLRRAVESARATHERSLKWRRLARWRRRVRASKRAQFRHVRGEKRVHWAPILRVPPGATADMANAGLDVTFVGDGQFTGDPAAVDFLLRGESHGWGKYRSARPGDLGGGGWDAFEHEYRAEIRSLFGAPGARAVARLEPITARSLRRAVRRGKAPGPDGWGGSELLGLPPPALEKLAAAFNFWEAQAEAEELAARREGRDVQVGRMPFPAVLARSYVALIPKAEESVDPLELRPLSLLSEIYRAWARLRCSDLGEWMAGWLPEECRGFSKHRGCEDVWWRLACDVEGALERQEALAALGIDLAKCFPQLPHRIMWKLCEAAGMPAGVLGLLKTFYGRLVERFRLGEGRVGEGFTPGRGICQGCPLSVLLVNVLFAVLVERTRTSAATRGGVVANYADDCTFWAQSDASDAGRLAVAQALRAFAGHVDRFTALTRQEINVRKSWILETGGALAGQAPIQLTGNVVPVVQAERVLGASVAVGGGPDALLQRRVAKAAERARNLERLPAPFDDRAALVGPGLLSLLYGQEAGPGVEPAERRRLRQSFAAAAFGRRMPRRCMEVVFTRGGPGLRAGLPLRGSGGAAVAAPANAAGRGADPRRSRGQRGAGAGTGTDPAASQSV